jgi:hypothetical protein
VPEEKREELFFLIPQVDTLVVPEELNEFPGRREPSRSIPGRGGTAQPHCLHESIVMVARKRDQGGMALHSTTLIRTRRRTRRLSSTRSDLTASDGSVATNEDPIIANCYMGDHNIISNGTSRYVTSGDNRNIVTTSTGITENQPDVFLATYQRRAQTSTRSGPTAGGPLPLARRVSARTQTDGPPRDDCRAMPA